MKKICIVIPTYNEEDNIPLIYKELINIFHSSLQSYAYELLFIDNHSEDQSRRIIEEFCKKDQNVKAIFNAKNFGFSRSTFYGLLQGTGDCTILLFADMQDPPETIIELINEWEKGYRIVIGIKANSKESKLMYLVRSAYYKFIKTIADIDHIEQFTGFGLYDKSFIEVLKKLDDPMPYLRGIIAELGYDRKAIYYTQNIRKYGKSSFNFFRLYDVAMLGITSYSKIVLRLATIVGFIMSIVCFFIGVATLVLKLINWESFQAGIAAISVGIFFLGSILLFFIGFQGEYILSINTRVMKRPLVVEDKRINF